MDTEEGKGEAKEEGEKKSPYILPIRCNVSVTCTEIEWETEITDENMATKTDASVTSYPLPQMSIAKS